MLHLHQTLFYTPLPVAEWGGGAVDSEKQSYGLENISGCFPPISCPWGISMDSLAKNGCLVLYGFAVWAVRSQVYQAAWGGAGLGWGGGCFCAGFCTLLHIDISTPLHNFSRVSAYKIVPTHVKHPWTTKCTFCWISMSCYFYKLGPRPLSSPQCSSDVSVVWCLTALPLG